MARALSVLLIEDHEERAREIERALRDHHFNPRITLATTFEGTRDVLREGDFDVVICEHELARISSRDALGLLAEHTGDVPLIVLSDQIDAQDAVEGIKSGAYDWIIWHHVERRLALAVDRALREAPARREHAEFVRRLEAGERRYRSIVDTMGDGLVTIDRRGIITFANQALADMTGFTLDEVIGSNARELLDEENIAILEEQLRQRFTGEKLGPISYGLEMVVRSGARTPLLITSTALRDEDGEVIGSLGVVTDMTEQQRAQEQLRRSQRMEAIGTLAGGIAHDFNNVLTAIIGHADLLSAEAEDGSSTEWHAVQIGDAAERAASLPRQLLVFSRRQPARPQVLDLNRIAGGMEEIFRRLIPEDIELRFDLAPDLGYTQIDPAQVEQLVMNLVVNARDAMPDGGVLTIATRNATLADDDMTELFDARPGDYVTLTVSDTGIGMDEETEARIFEPFFTTKAKAGGSGLGLSTVYGIVRQHDGTITVYGEPGQGSIFRIYLPRTDRPADTDRRAAAGDREALRGSELLLIVEDAENLRTLVQTMLGTLGYTVLSAGGGPEAIELAAAHAGEIDMLVTDVVMPEMSGTELAELLIVDNPQMHVLYVSGYPSERALDAERTDARFSFLQKPFSAVQLGRRLREILDSDPPGA